MRDLIVFLLLLTALFFGVGEWRGWYLGVPGQTPIFVYKKDFVAEATRQTINTDGLPLTVGGRVRQGSVTVEVLYEQPASFQEGTGAQRSKQVFEQQYQQGQRIAIDERFEEGKGIYTLKLTFEKASATLRVGLPNSAQL